MKRHAFTAIEALLTLGIISITAGVTVPVYRNYQIRSELTDATEQLLTAMRSAQVRARAGETAGTWGVHTSDGTLFQGDSFAERDTARDEHYPFSPTITVTGLSEVVFLPLSGTPVSEGEVNLTAQNGDSRTILIGEQGTVSATGLSTPSIFGGGSDGSVSSEGEAGEGGSSASAASEQGSSVASSEEVSSAASSGASTAGSDGSVASQTSSAEAATSASAGASDGPQGGGTSSSLPSSESGESSDASDDASTSSSVASSSSSTPGGSCEDRFFVGPDGTLQTTGRVRVNFRVLGSQITYGVGGPDIDVRVQASTDGGRTWKQLFGNSDVDGGEEEAFLELATGSKILIKVNGKYSWYFNTTFVSNSGDGHIEVLRNGSDLPQYPTFGNQAGLKSFLKSIVSNGKISIGTYDAVYLTELGSLLSSSADFQDLVLLVQFEQVPGSCTSSSSSSSSSSSAGSSVSSDSDSSGQSTSADSSQSSSASSESGKKIQICHFANNQDGQTITISESGWPAHAAHGDRKGECQKDDDDDGIDNDEDFCPGTKVEQPKKYLLFFRNALTQNDSDIFRVGPTKKISSYTLDDTGGCSCEQLLDVAEGKPGYYFTSVPGAYRTLRNLLDAYVSTARKYGCSSDLLRFIEDSVNRR